ncbi:hypothetical protein [Sandaracinus amylolyticus]|uniref:hypothetical protein n=1 Tax=Sandaracinus amylolyticus TaxID=927083 RepID=UPI001F3E7BB9|nr:hypothetical protein [Sandaracinus amylolyticus]UJR86014.1 Hypothetical protein I5071_80950 [Sandaracinus amylolyticus]
MAAIAALGLTLGIGTGLALRANAQTRAYRECYAQALVFNDITATSTPQTTTPIPIGWTIVGVHGRPAAVVLCR